jgi:2,4-dienoyl-CoA reductase-like NADH-dependent reductase (Old Yellow Enzyme family)/thioredoxin reductase
MEKDVTNDLQLDAIEKHEGLSRRKFLAGTSGVSAALAVAATGLLGATALSETSDTPSAVRAADKPPIPANVPAPKTTGSSKKYKHLLAPIKIGNTILKNKMIATAAAPHLLVGPDAYPTEALIASYANKARNGASLIVVSQPFGIRPTNNEDVLKIRTDMPNQVNPDHGTDVGHFPSFDLDNAGCQNILSQMTEAMHFYGSKCLLKPKIECPAGYDASSGNPEEIVFGTDAQGNFGVVVVGPASHAGPPKKEITEEMLNKVIEDTITFAVLAKECGFDGMYLHMAYRAPLTARMLSPLTNRRTDKYGGSLENRTRFCVELMDGIKKRCGQDFFLMGAISGCEPTGGYTLDDAAEMAKIFTPYLDLLNVKGDPGERDSAPTNFQPLRTPFLYMTEAYKKKGVTLPLCSDGGFIDLDVCEKALDEGKVDVVAIARGWITNPEYGRLAFEGRNEDVVPCIRCNACHGLGFFKPWNSACAVNPVWGLEHKIDKMILPPVDKKKVAVIGGGPAGMEAALIATKRGHKVTLYEKTGSLGGTFKTFENVSFKWPHTDFKNYLVRQIAKSGVAVRLNTAADPAMIKREGYDAVIVALGAEPIMPEIPGIKGKNVYSVTDVFGKERTLAKDVVIIGGGQSGVETGMHLAEKGHNVTVLEKESILARDAVRIHYYSAFKNAWEQFPNFKYVLNANCTGITEDGVTYMDADGKQQSLKAGSMVVSAGMKAQTELALKFQDAGDRFYMVGDCEVAADLQRAMRTAFSTASML